MPARARPALRLAGPYVGLFVLNLLFVLPAILPFIKERPYVVLQPSGDLWVLVAVCVITAPLRHGRWVRRAAMLIAFMLWMFWWDAFIGRVIVHQTPLFYDQLFLLKHVLVLISDLWGWLMFGGIVGAITVLFVSIVTGRSLWLAVTRSLAARHRRQVVAVCGSMLAVMVGTMAVTRGAYPERPHAYLSWAAPELGDNLRRSYRMYEAIEEGMAESPYSEYVAKYPLERKPDVHLFFVESYGSVLAEHPETRPRWLRKTRMSYQALQDAGWYAVTGYSTAPVSGGRSWLAEVSVLTGTVVRYEALYRHLIDRIDTTPNLVGYLDAQGYETFLLAPKDRARRGVQLENHYRYDQTIFALDLDYRGPAVGWGVVPDQYSLGIAEEYYYRPARVERPIFTVFHMVSSHAPWNTVPKIQEDWELLNDPDGEDPFEDLPPEADGREVMLRMKRFKRRDPRYLYMGEADAMKLKAYARAIEYDIEVIERFLVDQDGDQLVIIMGDHQPPLLWEVTENNYDVPVHILARDEEMLEVFREHGFTDGMQLEQGEAAAIGHEALFSLIVRTLAQCCGVPGGPLPTVQLDGLDIEAQ